jgi:bile acid-coenzyme A ligase
MNQLMPLGMVTAFHAARAPNRPMATFGDETATRGQMEARANRRARMLAAQGVGQGDMVTLVLPNGFDYLESCLALWKLGATPQPLSSVLPGPELRAFVDLVRPKLVIGADPAELPGYAVNPRGTPLDENLSAEPLPPVECKYWRANASGGSTGTPKIIVTHGGTSLDPMAPFMGLQVDGVQLNPGPLYHSGPLSFAAMGWFVGSHVVDGGRFDPASMLALIERHQIGWLYLVPTMMHRIWRLPADVRESFDLSTLHTIWHMAAHCPVWLKQHWIDWLGPELLWELYGSTEAHGCTVINGVEWLARKGSVGKVAPTFSLAVLNEQGERCAPNEVGEIYFKPDGGKGATYHYIGATAKAVGEWESPGDLGYVDEDGYLYIVDRRTDMIVSGGANVFPAEVEAAIEAHPDVECAIVIGLPDDDLGHRVHALVECKPGASIAADTLWDHVASRIVRYKVPRQFEFVTEPLRDSAGKVRRSALREERIKAAEALAGPE